MNTSIKDSIVALQSAVAACEKECAPGHGLTVCRASREVWDAFDAYLLSSSGVDVRKLAEESVRVLSRGIKAMKGIRPTDSPDGKKLTGYIHSVSERKADLSALASGGLEAFRARTLKSAFSAPQTRPAAALVRAA